ncbi:hypothetical protein NQ314_012947 [Rhamnusium bicolor]|uniref:Uncharacterized protein n=1 Tax=Rhamnusium bicolor TaxID=1586634 RepID=A0AAV8X9N0_9CUCU|nr:hypothetical protein NQ314_012947 [Rhamnusium bicolor]
MRGMVCVTSRSSSNSSRHPGRVLHIGSCARKFVGKGQSVSNQLGTSRSILVTEKRRAGPDDPVAVYCRFPIVSAGSRPI